MNNHQNPPRERYPVILNFPPEEGRTQQSFAKDADINNIMDQYAKTGQIIQLNPLQPTYGYIPSETYQESLNLINEAEQMFDALPSAVRKKFEHDPEKFLNFAMDQKNLPEMAELGLLTPEAAKAALVAVAATETLTSDPEEPVVAPPPPTPPE